MISTDIRWQRIPNGAQLSLLCLTELSLLGEKKTGYFHSNLVGLYVLLAALLIRALSGARVGMGDVKLISILAIGLGSTSEVLSSLTIASLLGLIWVLMARNRIIPFAPALIGGVLVVLLLNL